MEWWLEKSKAFLFYIFVLMYMISRKGKCDNAGQKKGSPLGVRRPGGCKKGWDAGPSGWTGLRLRQDHLPTGTEKKDGYMSVNASTEVDLVT